MNERSKTRFIETLQRKIAEGHFNSDNIVSGVVDEIATVLNESMDRDI